MSELLDLLQRLDFLETRSLLQTGNLVFRSKARTGSSLERFLEAQAEKRLDLRTDFFVRTAMEWEAVIESNPFGAEAKRDPGHVVVMFLKQEPSAADVDALRAAITGPERIFAEGRQAYVVYPAGIGRSRLTNTLIEKKLGTRCTGRNWNTILKLSALVS